MPVWLDSCFSTEITRAHMSFTLLIDFEYIERIVFYFAWTLSFFFFFNDTATTEISPLSLPDALPICQPGAEVHGRVSLVEGVAGDPRPGEGEVGDGAGRVRGVGVEVLTGGLLGPREQPYRDVPGRSEEHTSELQSLRHLVCRLLLEKK